MIIAFFQQDLVEAELFLPWSAQQLRGGIYARCQVLEEHSDNTGTFFRVRGEPNAVIDLREQFNRVINSGL
jgi:GTP-binding protein HflX